MSQCRCGHRWFWHDADPPQRCQREGCSCRAFKPEDTGDARDEGAPRPAGRSGRVLVVDDEPMVRKLFRRILEDAGFAVVAAENGEEALRILRSGPAVCLVLLDLRMPTMDGPAFRAVQRQDRRLATIPTIVVTGSPVPEALREELRAADYLLKPIRRDQLLRAVGRHCRPSSDHTS